MMSGSHGGGMDSLGGVGDCDPVGVFRRLRHLPGLVFFDSSGHLPAGQQEILSRIAVAPLRECCGRLDRPEDLARLREELRLGAASGHPTGGLAGWISYEGEFGFGVYAESLVYDQLAGEWREPVRVQRVLRMAGESPPQPGFRLGEFRPLMDRQDYVAAVRRAQEWIAAGHIYQVNLAQCFEAEVEGGPLHELYLRLREVSPAPMAGWFSVAGHEVLCSSPERFLRLADGMVTTQPIKGTRPRGSDPAADALALRELCESAKETAELVMITDLLRNDLGKVCRYGSVKVLDLLRVESLAQVHHLVSTVCGELRQGLGIVDLLEACFPGGSITGAPKKRAMEIIRELEPVPRGVYCGTLAWLGFDGGAECNIAIRTLVRRGTRLSYHCGAGIVADSDPQMEYEETLHKAAGIRRALRQCQVDP